MSSEEKLLPQKQNYKKTPKGVLSVLHSKMRGRTKSRNMQDMDLDLTYLQETYLNDPEFKRLFNDWVISNYTSELKPSIDRIDPNKGYTKDNIQLLTWGQNKSKGNEENRRVTTSVIMFDLSGNKIKDFDSVKDAAKYSKVPSTNIVKCCKGKHKTAQGYTFKYRGDKFRYKNSNLELLEESK